MELQPCLHDALQNPESGADAVIRSDHITDILVAVPFRFLLPPQSLQQLASYCCLVFPLAFVWLSILGCREAPSAFVPEHVIGSKKGMLHAYCITFTGRSSTRFNVLPAQLPTFTTFTTLTSSAQQVAVCLMSQGIPAMSFEMTSPIPTIARASNLHWVRFISRRRAGAPKVDFKVGVAQAAASGPAT